MKVKYFADTDTALLEFSDHPPVETREINENLYIDVDAQGRVVSVTIEHAHNRFRCRISPIPNHANVTGWPTEKPAQKIIAQQIAAASGRAHQPPRAPA